MVALASAFVRLRPQVDKGEFQKAGQQAGADAGKAAGSTYADGFYKDANGRLRAANGRFATDAEKAALGSGGKAGSAFASGFGKKGGELKKTITSNLKLGAGVFVPLGLAGAVAEIGKIGIAYEDNLNIFKTVSKATGAQMDAVAEKARQLGSDVQLPGVSAAGAAEAMTELAKAGFTVQQSMDAARATLQLSRIANITEGQAAEIAANAVNAFGIKAGDTSKVVDELAAAANSSSIEITEASDSFKQAASTFSGFQGPAVGSQEAITELNTAIAILGNNGIKGSDAGTSLKQMLLQLTGPSQQAKDIMRELALNAGGANVSLENQNKILHGSKSVREKAIAQIEKSNKGTKNMGDIAFTASGKMRSLRDILKLTAAGTKGMTDEEKDYAVTQIFGADASRSVIALLKGGLPTYDKQRKAILQQGAAADFAKAKNAGLGGAVDNVKSQFENAAIEIYNQVKGPLTTGLNLAAQAVSPLANGIRDLGTFIRENSGVIGAAATVIGGMAGAFLALRTAVVLTTAVQKAWIAVQAVIAFVQLASQVRSFAEAWALLDAAMAANPIGLVVVALGALVAGLIYAYKHSETFRNIVNGALNGIKVAALAVVGFFIGVVWPGLVAAFHAVESAALFLWHNVFIPVWQGIQAAVSTAVAVVRAIIGGFVAAFHAVQTAVQFLYNVFAPVFAAITKIVQIWWLINEIIFKAFQLAIRVVVAGALYVLRAVWNAIFSALRVAVSTWWLGVKTIFNLFRSYLLGPFLAGLTATKNLFVGIFRAIASYLVGWYNSNIKPIFGLVASIWRSMASGISATWHGVIKPIFDAVVYYVKHTLVDGFKGGVALIKAAWAGVQAAARVPVAFVVNHVINPFIGGLNKAASIVGVKDRVEPIKGFAAGGKISGAGGITDNRQAVIPGVGAVQLQGGEFVVNRQATAQALPLLRWLNTGMKGGPNQAARYIGRPMADMPGDGSEGWQFKSGGLIGWASDVWDSVTHPLDTIKRPFEAALNQIPGGGTIKDFLIGAANRLVTGSINWVKSIAGGGGKVGDATSFLHKQDGKPYIWASAGPDGYDCSGIVSAVYNILHGRSPYSHTFSTESAGQFFPKQGQNGPMATAWSHPGQSPAGASVGHMMGRVGNLNFESTGSRGVHLGKTTRQLSDFAQIGHYLTGGKVQLFDQGGPWKSGTLGANMSGHTEYVDPKPGRAGVTEFHAHFHGPVSSQRQAEDLVYTAYKQLVKDGKIKEAKRG